MKNWVKKLKNPETVVDYLVDKFNKARGYKGRLAIAQLLIYVIIYFGYSPQQAEVMSTDVAAIEQIARNDNMSKEEAYDLTDHLVLSEETETSDLFTMDDEALISALNTVVKKRFSSRKADQYDQYDAEIAQAVEELKAEGENPPPAKFLKAMMLIETGMRPRKNHLGYEGFPQTKKKFVNSINKRNGTDFKMRDMYDAKESAKFIHYYIKTIKRSEYVKNDIEAVGAYNWGTGNWAKYKQGLKKLPKETKDYMDLVSIMMKNS